MKVGILGAGSVGSNLGNGLVRAGHEVMLSSRTPGSEKMQALVSDLGAEARAGSVDETLAFSPTTALALSWNAIPDVVTSSGNWGGRIVIDISNRFGPAATASGRSAAEELAQMTGARVVKALNTIGAEHYVDPHFQGQAATMFIAGDDPEAKQLVSGLITDLGFEVVDAGDLAASLHLEAVARFWVHLARNALHNRDVAFKLLRK